MDFLLQATENVLHGNWNHKHMYYPLKGMLSIIGQIQLLSQVYQDLLPPPSTILSVWLCLPSWRPSTTSSPTNIGKVGSGYWRHLPLMSNSPRRAVHLSQKLPRDILKSRVAESVTYLPLKQSLDIESRHYHDQLGLTMVTFCGREKDPPFPKMSPPFS